jgi:hypothetical protein
MSIKSCEIPKAPKWACGKVVGRSKKQQLFKLDLNTRTLYTWRGGLVP